ncbi:diguanylate cyclase [Niveibacterium sp.]|uniref:sensor domain-containing diguanylate cyclase n=1 Tax=Niveibacterium sp. TaxID=2017444 RepID=UPI0035B2D72B
MSCLFRLLCLVCWLCPMIADAAGLAFRLERLPPDVAASEATIRAGKLDDRFALADTTALRDLDRPTWFRVVPMQDWPTDASPALVVRQTRFQVLTVFPGDGSAATKLGALRADYPTHLTRGLMIFPLGVAPRVGVPIYLLAEPGGEPTQMRPVLSIETRDAAEAASLTHVRLAIGTFGALLTLALCGVCVWLMLRESLFLLFSSVVACQGFYVAMVFGEGLSLPGMDALLPIGGRLVNLFAGLGALCALMFARRMVDIGRIAPRLDRSFVALQWAYVLLLIAVPLVPSSGMVVLVALGNLTVMAGTAMVLAAGFLGWRSGSRAAAFFLLAWMMMQGFTFARTASFLLGTETGPLLYYGFPLSMVVAGVMLALGLADRVREMRHALREAQRRAQIDALTGALNRRSILERLDAARIAFRETGEPVSVLFIDLDHFKRINDIHGHLAGDACLREACKRVGSVLRRTDALGRYGGEEFLVVLQGAAAPVAGTIAEQIRAAVAAEPVCAWQQTIAMSCSVGVASSSSDALSAEDLIARADAALYAAKRDGRNRVALAPLSPLVAPPMLAAEGESLA